MRILRLTLRNYIGIYNGLGLTEITIDFTQCKHHVLVIKGDNGSGKSTLFRALTPFNDPSSEFINGKEGYKEIWYLLNDNSILKISYSIQCTYDEASNKFFYKGSKCSIIRMYNGLNVELNPSNNITSGRDVIYELFDLNDNYLILSAISTNNRGIGLLRPSDRKKYVNLIIDYLNDYIDLYKTLSKKSNVINSILRNLVSKLSQLGNIEELESRLHKSEEIHKSMLDRESSIIGEISVLKNSLSLLGSKSEIESSLADTNSKIDTLSSELKNLDNVLNLVCDIDTLKAKYQDNSLKLKYNQDKIQDLMKREEELRRYISELEYKISSSEDTNLDELNNKIQEIKQKISNYELLFRKIGFSNYNNLTSDEYGICLDLLEEYNDGIAQIHSTYDRSIIEESINNIKNNIELKDVSNDIVVLRKKLDLLKAELYRKEVLLKQQSLTYSIPQACQYKNSCIFVKDLLIDRDELQKEYDDLTIQIKETEDKIQELESYNERLYTITECMRSIYSILNILNKQGCLVVLQKFCGDNRFDNRQFILDSILNNDYISIDFSLYWEYKGYLDMISSLREELTVYESKMQEYENNQLLIVYKDLLSSKKQELVSLCDNKNDITKSTKSLESITIQLHNIITKHENLSSERDRYQKLTEELRQANDEYKTLQDKLSDYTRLSKQLEKLTYEYGKLKHNISLISQDLDKLRYNKLLYQNYQEEYKKYLDINKKFQILKESCSVNGLQSIYIESYMNNMLKHANELLRMLFDGRFMIKEFIVNETEFLIPCIDSNGKERYDIRDMSDSQITMISMIISFVILYHASKCYNIIKLDEVDASLDTNNRLYFSQLIKEVIRLLNFDQCIIISHNSELDLQESDMIILRVNSDEELQYLKSTSANIIYNYNE